MIVSDQYKYVFIELSHTASSALHAEFCEFYGGKEILRKHAKYNEFLRLAPEKQDYRVIAGIRNPLDVFVSVYLKYKNNHKGNYTDPKKLRENGGWVTSTMMRQYRYVQEEQHGFVEFLKEFYWFPYYDYKCYANRSFDAMIGYENLQDDFSHVLKEWGIEKVRELPIINPTGGKSDNYLDYYPEEIRTHVVRVFGPYLADTGYGLPEEWEEKKIPLLSWFFYSISGWVKVLYWKYVRNSNMYLSIRRLPREYGSLS